VRQAGFRWAVVGAYDHRCALCGVRLVTDEGRSAATAAHIVPWRLTRNDDPRNGLCLCRLCHWVFDEGLAAVLPSSHVQLASQCRALGNIAGALQTLEARPLFDPVDPAYRPDPAALAWHREHTFLG
jgi:putative restriction endonuclease